MDWEQALERVRRAAEFCASAGLARFRVDEDDLEVEVRRGGVAPSRPPAATAQPSHSFVAPASNGALEHDAPAPPAPTVLKAEFVGIVRLSRPFVAEGTEIAGDRELAYVESLGVRNPVRWSGHGRVATVFVNDGQPVEFGQPLFAVEVAS